MDTSCGCFGIAASSRRPVKRYNDLVPDCFPRNPPPVTQKSDAAQERKYKKLCEYLNNNPDRIPKASLSTHSFDREGHRQTHRVFQRCQELHGQARVLINSSWGKGGGGVAILNHSSRLV